jgi:Ca2+-binding EF-hand superfamily protein
MKLSTFLGAGLLALVTAATTAQAQQQPERKAGDLPGPIDSLQDLQDTGRMIFKMADANNDGQISQQEAINAANLVVGGFFFNADKNGDGVLSKDEARQAREEFLSQKPWLRYVIETAETTPKATPGQPAPNAAQPAPTGANANPLMALAKAFDTNNDGQLQATELRQAVQTAVQSIFASADSNRDNQLSPTELNAAIAGLTRTAAQSVFQAADTDGNGQISEAEFEKAIIQPARVAFRVMDLNHDGQISQQEAQTARQVVMSKLRMFNMPEAPNSPRNMINSAIGNPTQPQAQPTTPPATATPSAPAPGAIR